ncbi:hypothetical protein V1280_008279 [Bradyrhizobium sp. AZCC 2230]
MPARRDAPWLAGLPDGPLPVVLPDAPWQVVLLAEPQALAPVHPCRVPVVPGQTRRRSPSASRHQSKKP